MDKSVDKIDDTAKSEEIILKTFPLDSLVDDIPDVLHDDKTTIEKPKTISDDFIQEMTHKMTKQMQSGLMGNIISPIALEPVATETVKDNTSISISDTLAPDDTEEVFELSSDNLISDINIDISDEEETFIIPNNQNVSFQKSSDIETSDKEKTLEELRGLLESKMQQFYKNELNLAN